MQFTEIKHKPESMQTQRTSSEQSLTNIEDIEVKQDFALVFSGLFKQIVHPLHP